MHRQTVVLNELDEDGETVVVTSSVACPMLAATHTQLTRTECRDALYTLQSINQSINQDHNHVMFYVTSALRYLTVTL